MKRVLICVLLLCTFILMGCQKKENNIEGVPDCVNSISTNEDMYLKVVANRETIEDKAEFAWEIIKMCQENTFKTIMFSYDLGGYPTSLDIDVYLWKDDIGEKDPVMHIEFKPIESLQGYDIVNDADKFELYVDKIKIES